jgi:hypothetical protein
MRIAVVTNRIDHSFLQQVFAPVLQFCFHRTFCTENNMSLAAPVISQVARRIGHHPYPHIIPANNTPFGNASNSLVYFGFDALKVGNGKRETGKISLIVCSYFRKLPNYILIRHSIFLVQYSIFPSPFLVPCSSVPTPPPTYPSHPAKISRVQNYFRYC